MVGSFIQRAIARDADQAAVLEMGGRDIEPGGVASAKPRSGVFGRPIAP